MDLTDIRKLVRLMIQAELSEVEIDDTKQGLRVHLKRGSLDRAGEGMVSPVVHVMPSAPSAPTPSAGVASAPPAATPGAPGADDLPPGTWVFKSPMVGTFYRAASPDADAFVEVGSPVDEDTVLCIIEAMKVMNEIKAETKGVVSDILVENGEPVEFGQPLFLLKKG
jgi:acetyl-CoA carboxylase biotin carboxyl carrier protein